MTSEVSKSILFVDDEQNVLDAVSRQLRKNYRMTMVCGPEEALRRIEAGESFAVVVSDYTMPKLTGVEFLKRVGDHLPFAIRMMLTGNANLQLAIEAVNRGHIFRLLLKPCAIEELRAALDAALEQYRLREAEKELLEKTLGGCVQLVADIVSHMCPDAFGRALRLRTYVKEIATRIGLRPSWHVETAALLSQLGIVAVPSEIVQRSAQRSQLSPEEKRIFDAHPRVARNILMGIPRLEVVAEIIGRQAPAVALRLGEEETPFVVEAALSAEVLRACIAFDELTSNGVKHDEAAHSIAALPGLPASIAAAAMHLQAIRAGAVNSIVPVQRLMPGMVLDQDLRRPDGQLVIACGHEITPTLLERLLNHVNLGQLTGNVKVRSSVGSSPNSKPAPAHPERPVRTGGPS